MTLTASSLPRPSTGLARRGERGTTAHRGSSSAVGNSSTSYAILLGEAVGPHPGICVLPDPRGWKSRHVFDRRAILPDDNADVRLPYGPEVRPVGPNAHVRSPITCRSEGSIASTGWPHGGG